MRITVRVQPGASTRRVGGRWGDGEPAVLMVRVPERAVDGRANDAVVRAVAGAFGVRRGAVSIVAGTTGRTKQLVVDGDDEELQRSLDRLLDDSSGRRA